MNTAYIATSLDGYIADQNGQINWLNDFQAPEGITPNNPLSFENFMDRIDALVMGRNTLEVVLSFGIDWPYSKPVYVLSQTLKQAPKGYEEKVFIVQGTPQSITQTLHDKGHKHLYIDGGKTIQSFLEADCIDEMILTQVPILLGGGVPLFGKLDQPRRFKIATSVTTPEGFVSSQWLKVNP